MRVKNAKVESSLKLVSKTYPRACVPIVKRVRAKFSKNCAFCDTSIIFTVRFHFDLKTIIRNGTISEMNVVDHFIAKCYSTMLEM